VVFGAQMLDDELILSWSVDGTVRLWDSESDSALLTLRHDKWVYGAQQIANGRILSWSRDGTVRLWDISTLEPPATDLDTLQRIAASLPVAPLTNEERAAYLLPTLLPTITATPFPINTALPPITPLPTLTPSVTPMLTAEGEST
jgi:WD40 repeat protein